MTVDEFSREFDILYNNIMSNAAPGIDDYEKSVFLTKAQEELVVAIYEGSFENSERYRESINSLVTTKLYSSSSIIHNANNQLLYDNNNFNDVLYHFPQDCLFIVYEQMEDADKNILLVIPTTHDAFYRFLKNPFKRPSKNKVFRLNTQAAEDDSIIGNALEIITSKNVQPEYCEYLIRYLRKPQPIILFDDPGGLTVNGHDSIIDYNNPCELPQPLHRLILETAVKMALETYKQYN